MNEQKQMLLQINKFREEGDAEYFLRLSGVMLMKVEMIFHLAGRP